LGCPEPFLDTPQLDILEEGWRNDTLLGAFCVAELAANLNYAAGEEHVVLAQAQFEAWQQQ